jgi:tRNA threonylcarbamoyladenosine biosynthesis protein TsaE
MSQTKTSDILFGRTHRSASVQQTLALGALFAASLNVGDVVLLRGDLGAGKTHFVKGIAEGLGGQASSVQSPTFTLVNEYPTSPILYHFDMYRLENEQQAFQIGFEEYLYGEGICVIEWPERVASLLPEYSIEIEIRMESALERSIKIGLRA